MNAKFLLFAIASALVSVGASAQSGPPTVSATVVNTPSNPVPVAVVGTRTHLGVPLENHVMLVKVSGSGTDCGANNGSFRQISPDGTVAQSEFVVPAGRSLVVLDVDAVITTPPGNSVYQTFAVGDSVVAALVTAANINTGVYMLHTTKGVTITTPGMYAVAVSSALSAGVIFGSGQKLCLRGEARSFGGGFFQSVVSSGAIRGYLL